MDPLHPDFRTALKQAHPSLTDAMIHRYEELTSQQFSLDRTQQGERFAALDREREQLLREYLPHYREIWEQFQKRHKRIERPPREK